MTEFRSKNFIELRSRVGSLRNRHYPILRAKLEYYRLPKTMRQEMKLANRTQ